MTNDKENAYRTNNTNCSLIANVLQFLLPLLSLRSSNFILCKHSSFRRRRTVQIIQIARRRHSHILTCVAQLAVALRQVITVTRDELQNYSSTRKQTTNDYNTDSSKSLTLVFTVGGTTE